MNAVSVIYVPSLNTFVVHKYSYCDAYECVVYFHRHFEEISIMFYNKLFNNICKLIVYLYFINLNAGQLLTLNCLQWIFIFTMSLYSLIAF